MKDLKEFLQHLSGICGRDTRYKEDAYLFVMTALSRAVQALEAPRHVTGSELLKGLQEEAEQQFGPMAKSVFEHWGVKNSLDFGHIVFNMVQEGILSKTDKDCLEDFRDGVFFENLFDGDSSYRLIEDEKIQAKDKDLSKK